MTLSPYQFHYVPPGYKSTGPAKGTKKQAKERATEDHGKVIATHPDDGIVGALTFSHGEWPNVGQGRGVDVVAVDPRHRGPELRESGKAAGRGGVAHTMYNLASREMGYRLGHSKSLSPAGARFAGRVGGPLGSKSEKPLATIPDHEYEPGALSTDMLKTDIAERATTIDPIEASALTPRRQRKTRAPKTTQGTIPGADWTRY